MTDKATHTPLPCPFCSGEPIIIHEDRVWIECADCPSKAEVGPFDTRTEALTAWNTRAVNSHHDLIEALTPSGDTKAAYMGEFAFNLRRVDEAGDEYSEKVYVPWDTIKEIMKAISARAAKEMPDV